MVRVTDGQRLVASTLKRPVGMVTPAASSIL